MQRECTLRCKFLERNAGIIVGGGLGLAGACYLVGKYRECQERQRLTSLRLRKQKERKEKFEELEKKYPLGAAQAEIVGIPFKELAQKLQKRELTATQVLEAYVANALVVTKDFNSITEFVPKCFEWAKELDALPSVKGPLHGIPICIKDDHDVEGMDTTMGYSIYLYQEKKESAVMVKILQEAGAIPFCKTNFPQTIFSSSSDNPIFGTTLNPHNKALSPGGSSSGTGSLVGAGAAPFGLGSDLGGSVRIPSHFCGISTLRSTIGRLSGKGVLQCLEDNAGYTGVSGVMACSARTLASVYKIITTDGVQNKYDPLTVPVPWNMKLFESKTPLRIGYYTSIPMFPSMGDTPGTVLKAKAALESLGHQVIPFELPDIDRMVTVYASLATADGGSIIYEKLRHDEIANAAQKFTIGRTWCSRLYQTLKGLVVTPNKRDFLGDPAVQESKVLWEYLHELRQIRNRVLDLMKDLNLDLILAPVWPFPASRVEDTEVLLGAVVYTCLYNLLDFPAGVTPFGKESCTKIDGYDDEGDFYLKIAKKGIKSAKDMSIGVQVIGKPFKEEMVLRVLMELEDYKLKHHK